MDDDRWAALPNDVGRLMLIHVRAHRWHAARRIQAAFIAHRHRLLVDRFRTLRYLREFRQFNPSLSEFLWRSRL